MTALSTVTASTASNESGSRGLFWAFVPAFLLASSLLGVGSMAVIAARDPGFSLERDYYTRAVHWDEQQAQNQENQRLGYRLSPVSTGPSALSVRLVDRNGEPVRGAVVRAEAFANARAANIRKLAFSEGAAGIYRVELGSARPGLWEFRFRVEHAGRVFTEVSRLDIPSGASAP